MIFSVVTSVYNGEQFIERAISSVNKQTERNFEYILVDNGSFDHTHSVVERYRSKNPDFNLRIVRLEKNVGISGGRNAGIVAAKGEYVCFLDADDYWYPQKLARLKHILKTQPDYDVICHWENHISERKCKVGKYRHVNNNNAYEDLLFHGNCLSTSATCVRRTLLNKIGGFNTSLISGEEDYDCWMRLAKEGAVFYTIDEVLGVWTIRNDSVSAKLVSHNNAVIKVIEKHFDEYSRLHKEVTQPELKKRKIISRILSGCGRNISLRGDREEGNKLYDEAIKKDPLNVRAYIGMFLNLVRK